MRRLSDTIQRLAVARRTMAAAGADPSDDRLRDLQDFGSNPGNLRARVFVPDRLADPTALVVVLHGCTQNAAGYDIGAGWSGLAERHGFALLLPEQQRANNPNLCFNWFSPEDMRRGSGEALSIRQMIAAIAAEAGIDPARVFVTGLSAGGAMAAVMLATYPELFAGGAIIAGLPYGTASTMPEAFDRMRGHGAPDAAALGRLVRAASSHRGAWPAISIWHGDADGTVHSSNAEASIAQWRAVHGLPASPGMTGTVDGAARRVWRDAEGRIVLDAYSIPGMGHGTPIDTRGDDPCGRAGAFMLDVGISSTRRIADAWGLTGATVGSMRTPVPGARSAATEPAPPHAEAPHGVGRIIDDALRAAGLLR